MTIKFQSGKKWFKGTLLGFMGDKYIVLFGDKEFIIDPDYAVLS